MNKTLIPLIVTILAIPASQAATTFIFNDTRFTQFGSVSEGTVNFDPNNSTADNTSASEITASFILTDDFDEDGENDTLTFELTATAVAPPGTSAFLNANGIVGIGNVLLDAGEAINYTVSVGAVVTSTGAQFAASFDGFTGGGFGNFDVGGIDAVGDSYNANGEVFTTSTFDFDSPSETLLLTGISGSAFNNSLDFGITVEAVPEPSSTALLGLGVLGFLVRRRR